MKADRHVDVSILARWVQEDLPEEERESVACHMQQCGHCQAESDLARAHFSVEPGTRLGSRSDRLQQEFALRLEGNPSPTRATPAAAPGSGRRPIWRGRRTALWMAAAAIGFAAIGLRQMGSTPHAPLPSGELLTAGHASGFSVELRSEDDGWSLLWTTERSLRDVLLTIETGEGTIIYRQPLDTPTEYIPFAALPAEESARLLFVRLSGLDEDGRRLHSDVQLLTRRPEGQP